MNKWCHFTIVNYTVCKLATKCNKYPLPSKMGLFCFAVICMLAPVSPQASQQTA